MAYNPAVPARERTPFGNFEIRPTHLRTKVTRVPYADERIAPEVAHAAALAVCARSEGVDDARSMLAMLGLVGA